ncbi:hypothetical protein CgunFtcFv8_001402 [Champsocephalus gunnari]|uniref:Uncharacterized protein n=1 Tax=Champsocephalus gunnari TaxID=52237 RepID=A0AAN8H804_CHAGU|nr:hypothetical protein CgunFtcFv8_001402 [Champsocephalus gunnari]
MLFQLLRAPLCGAPSVLPRCCVRSLRSAPCRTPAMRPSVSDQRPEDPEDPEPGGGVEEPEQNAADVHRCRRRGDDRPIVRLRASL